MASTGVHSFWLAKKLWWDLLVAEQGGEFCAACGGTNQLELDHDHLALCGCNENQRCPECVRGILCRKCNQVASRLESWRVEGVQRYLALKPRPLLRSLPRAH